MTIVAEGHTVTFHPHGLCACRSFGGVRGLDLTIRDNVFNMGDSTFDAVRTHALEGGRIENNTILGKAFTGIYLGNTFPEGGATTGTRVANNRFGKGPGPGAFQTSCFGGSAFCPPDPPFFPCACWTSLEPAPVIIDVGVTGCTVAGHPDEPPLPVRDYGSDNILIHVNGEPAPAGATAQVGPFSRRGKRPLEFRGARE